MTKLVVNLDGLVKTVQERIDAPKFEPFGKLKKHPFDMAGRGVADQLRLWPKRGTNPVTRLKKGPKGVSWQETFQLLKGWPIEERHRSGLGPSTIERAGGNRVGFEGFQRYRKAVGGRSLADVVGKENISTHAKLFSALRGADWQGFGTFLATRGQTILDNVERERKLSQASSRAPMQFTPSGWLTQKVAEKQYGLRFAANRAARRGAGRLAPFFERLRAGMESGRGQSPELLEFARAGSRAGHMQAARAKQSRDQARIKWERQRTENLQHLVDAIQQNPVIMAAAGLLMKD